MIRMDNDGPFFLKKQSIKLKHLDRKGVSPVIAVILLVGITVVLVSLLYIMVSNMISESEFTPRGVLYFNSDPDIQNKYNGKFEGSVKLDKIEIVVTDASLGESIILDPDVETQKEITGGLNITFENINDNDKLDGPDVIVIEDGGVGDLIKIVYKSTGETSGWAKLN